MLQTKSRMTGLTKMGASTPLNQELAEVELEIIGRRGEGIRALFDAQVSKAGSHLATASCLQAGDIAPEFSLLSTTDQAISLQTALLQGPVILTFYRGSWCNFCDMTLKVWENYVPEISAKGATLFAISPETSENGRAFKKAAGLSYELLCDADNSVGDAYGLTFTLPKIVREKLVELGTDVGSRNSSGEWGVPVTATFLIGRDQHILLADCGPDYRQRLDPKLVLESL